MRMRVAFQGDCARSGTDRAAPLLLSLAEDGDDFVVSP